MPLYELNGGDLKTVPIEDFRYERDLQRLIEVNLEETFGCRFIATEFSTGPVHAGRIDTLAISENNNPVIIEYKKTRDAELLNQGLYYLSWLKDHHGDFEIAAQKVFPGVVVDWSQIRVICIAPGYTKFALHAAQQSVSELEIWKYKKFTSGHLELELLNKPSMSSKGDVTTSQAKTQISEYSVETHLSNTAPEILELVEQLRGFILNLDDSITETPKKLYIAFKLSKNLVCLEVQRNACLVFLNHRDPSSEESEFVRDVSQVGHYGTGNLQIRVTDPSHLPKAMDLIDEAYKLQGGE